MPLSPRGSKAKGDRFERELAAYLNVALFNGDEVVHRAPLSGGGRSWSGAGRADLNGTPHLWVEAKRTERLRPNQAMRQAVSGCVSARCPDIPVVISRQSNIPTGDSICMLRLDDFLKLYRAYLATHDPSTI